MQVNIHFLFCFKTPAEHVILRDSAIVWNLDGPTIRVDDQRCQLEQEFACQFSIRQPLELRL
jgi:hypothetical protein